jgi:hypothetical protein
MPLTCPAVAAIERVASACGTPMRAHCANYLASQIDLGLSQQGKVNRDSALKNLVLGATTGSKAVSHWK